MRIIVATLMISISLIMGSCSDAQATRPIVKPCVSKAEWASVYGSHQRMHKINQTFGFVGKRTYLHSFERGWVQIRHYRNCSGGIYRIDFYRPLTIGTPWYPDWS
jgi:hypothetical protein